MTMLKKSQDELDRLEDQYAGIVEHIRRIEDSSLPSCPDCSSNDTAEVGVGVIGRTIAIAAATTKFKLVPNNPLAAFFCNACQCFFDHPQDATRPR